METITFHCKVITPMFLAGADGRTPELRPPSLKGAMRFWWRAVNGHLPLAELKKQESDIFGGSGDNVKRSKIIARVFSPDTLRTSTAELVPHKPSLKALAIEPGQEYSVQLSLTRSNAAFDLQKLRALFELTCLLGGLGKRVRRGMGSVHIIGAESPDPSFQNPYPLKADLGHIHNLINVFSPFYSLTNDAIQFNYSGRSEKYGYIKQIQLGKPQNEQLLFTISNATHKIKERNRYAYDPSMGYAFGGRYASPVYVSTMQGSLRPVITTLNIAPNRNELEASYLIQEDFKNLIL
ncbi:MAG: type III-B CRISPR module RAMP protein Cmr1 [Lewinellaceae bacterium]|nr:type III-B CRISPR module RAMP protein Cmr1 [Lewinellaceae bacterium]